MPFVGHLPELFLLLLLALIIFGPKRMIDMASSLGRALREVRDQLKDVPGMGGVANLGGLLDDNEPRRTPYSTMSQFSQSIGAEVHDESETPSPPATPTELAGPSALANAAGGVLNGTTSTPSAGTADSVVEGTIQHSEEHPEQE